VAIITAAAGGSHEHLTWQDGWMLMLRQEQQNRQAMLTWQEGWLQYVVKLDE